MLCSFPESICLRNPLPYIKSLTLFGWDHSWQVAAHMVFRCRNRGFKRQTTWPLQWNARILQNFTNLSWIYVLIWKDIPFLMRESILEFQNHANIFHSKRAIQGSLLWDSNSPCKQLLLLIKFQAFFFSFLFWVPKVETFFSNSSFPSKERLINVPTLWPLYFSYSRWPQMLLIH